MGFKDLSEFLQPGLVLPIRGKNYTIPAPSAEEGLRLHLLFQDPNTSYTDSGELREIMKLLGAEWTPNLVTVDVHDPITGEPVLDDKGEPVTTEIDRGTYSGGVYEEMAADGLSWPEIMHAGRTALFDAGQGRTIAELMWTQTGTLDSGNLRPPTEGEPEAMEPGVAAETGNRAQRRAKKTPAKKAASSKAGTGSTTRDRKRTAKTTPGAATTTP